MAIYMHIPHQRGTVKARSYNGWIEAQGFSFGTEREISTVPGNTANRIYSPTHTTEILIYKITDQTSPFFFSEACTGKSIDQVKIDVVETSGLPFIQYLLDNVIVSEYTIFIIENGVPIEAISLNFTHLEIRYISYEQGRAIPTSTKAQTGSSPTHVAKLRRHVEKQTDEGFKLFVATVYGKAANQSETAWKAIGSVIINRVQNKRFLHHLHDHYLKCETTSEVIIFTGFDAYTRKTREFNLAMAFLEGRLQNPPQNLSHMIDALKPIYYTGKVTTNAILYYSPKTQARKHLENPRKYLEKPKWRFSEISEVTIPGLSSNDDFKFFRYK